MWPRVYITTKREGERRGENDEWDGNNTEPINETDLKKTKMIGAANNSTNVIGSQKPLTREAHYTRFINAEFFCVAAMLYKSNVTHLVVGNEGSGECRKMLTYIGGRFGVDWEKPASYEIDIAPYTWRLFHLVGLRL